MSVSVIPDPEVSRKARDYWEVDGLPTILRGVGWLLLASFIYAFGFGLRAYVKDGINGLLLILVGVPTLIFLFAWMSSHVPDLLRLLKGKITYPRTGYIASPDQWRKPPEPENPTLRVRVSRFFERWWLVFYIGSFYLPHFQMRPWMLVALGTAIGLFRVSKLKDRVFWIEVLGYPILGIAAALLFETHARGSVAVAWLAPGLILVLRGVMTLFRYLQQNPLAQP